MNKDPKNSPDTLYDTEELKGFARSLSELQVLLLILVFLYYFVPTQPIINHETLIATMAIYTVFVMSFRYFKFHSQLNRWKLALETWAMIGFITAVLWHTGLVQSPLLNLYLLVIIACAITLGKIMTLLEVILIACVYIYMGYKTYSTGIFVAETFTVLMAKFSPFLLVAYVTSMLAADILSAKKKITRLSHTDDLTGLLNMRAFNLILDKEIKRAARHRQPYTIVMIDVDNLKSVNDQYGHPAGSRLVTVIASSIRNCVRASDVLARYGGDEFVILMTHTSTGNARVVADRIRNAILNTSFDTQGSRVTATVSVGIASFPDNVEKAADVLEKADIALYRSKQDGRNKVSYYDEEMELEPVPAGSRKLRLASA
jgi:diguanylate cyclase (GGDEF)-like protein